MNIGKQRMDVIKRLEEGLMRFDPQSDLWHEIARQLAIAKTAKNFAKRRA